MYAAQRVHNAPCSPGAASMLAALRRAAPRCTSSALIPSRAVAARAFRVAAAAERETSSAVVRSDASLLRGRRLISRAASAPDATATATAADALRLYNTLSRQKEVFKPRADQVRGRALVKRTRSRTPVVKCASPPHARQLTRRETGQQGLHVRLRRDGVRLQARASASAGFPPPRRTQLTRARSAAQPHRARARVRGV